MSFLVHVPDFITSHSFMLEWCRRSTSGIKCGMCIFAVIKRAHSRQWWSYWGSEWVEDRSSSVTAKPRPTRCFISGLTTDSRRPSVSFNRMIIWWWTGRYTFLYNCWRQNLTSNVWYKHSIRYACNATVLLKHQGTLVIDDRVLSLLACATSDMETCHGEGAD